MAYNGSKWEDVGKSGATQRPFSMVETAQSLSELARDMNMALVRVGRASWRREFNARLWACNRDKAFELIGEYRKKIVSLISSQGQDASGEWLVPLVRR
jgi:hypothetical protein